MPLFHPDDDVLFEYASGSQEEPVALVVASHLALCPQCRSEVDRLEEIGGVLLETNDPQTVHRSSIDQVLEKLDGEPLYQAPEKSALRSPYLNIGIPQPLRRYLDEEIEPLAWKSYRNLEEVALLSAYPDFRTRLMRIKAGAVMPAHTHSGTELTLVLTGGFSDEHGHYLRGDLSEADATVVHKPVADEGEDCVCLAVTQGALRLTGPIGHLLNPFVSI